MLVPAVAKRGGRTAPVQQVNPTIIVPRHRSGPASDGNAAGEHLDEGCIDDSAVIGREADRKPRSTLSMPMLTRNEGCQLGAGGFDRTDQAPSRLLAGASSRPARV